MSIALGVGHSSGMWRSEIQTPAQYPGCSYLSKYPQTQDIGYSVVTAHLFLLSAFEELCPGPKKPS